MSTLSRGAPVVVFALLLGVTACSSDSGQGASVTSTDTECTPERTTFPAGKLTFTVVNRGRKPTELYVFGANDKVISEVENVGPGTSRRLHVDLTPGRYQLGCKPGQTGAGIRADITVTASDQNGRPATKPADRDVDLTAIEYAFNVNDPAIKVGETIRFVMDNRGGADHNFQVLDARGRVLGEIPAIRPGKTGNVTITFDRPGTYRFICDVDDHLTRGMRGAFTVTPA